MANVKGDKIAASYADMYLKLSYRASKVLRMLAWHTNAQTGRRDPSIPRLARSTGQCERNVRRAINELERAGAVKKARHGGGSATNAYNVQWDYLREQYQSWLEEHGLAAATPDKTVTPPLTKLSNTPDKTARQTKKKL